MINLLPPLAQNNVSKIYRARLARLGLSALLLLLLICDGLLLPSWLLLHAKSQTITAALAQARLRPISKEADAAKVTIREANNKIKLLSDAGAPTTAGAILDKVLSDKDSSVSIVAIDRGSDNTVIIKGVAKDREALLAYIKTLQADTFWSNVTSPISNLIESSDIGFTINMRVSAPAK